MNREHWVDPSFAHILSIFHKPFSRLLYIQEDFEVIQRSDQKYSMALFVECLMETGNLN